MKFTITSYRDVWDDDHAHVKEHNLADGEIVFLHKLVERYSLTQHTYARVDVDGVLISAFKRNMETGEWRIENDDE